MRKLCSPGTTRARCPRRPIVDSGSLGVVVLFVRSWLMFVVQATKFVFQEGDYQLSKIKKSQPRMTFDSGSPASALSLSFVSMLLWGVGSSG
jgi:hypothetical protein